MVRKLAARCHDLIVVDKLAAGTCYASAHSKAAGMRCNIAHNVALIIKDS